MLRNTKTKRKEKEKSDVSSPKSRGRAIKKTAVGKPPSKDTIVSKLKALATSLPEHPRDTEMVVCSECGQSSTFREFRIHNIESHYNLAKTLDDETVLDHKYFVRKLLELGRLAKLTAFFCPRTPCEAFYRSALGLAYHLEACGKTDEEREAYMVECEICKLKFPFQNLNSHRKSKHPQPDFLSDPSSESSDAPFTPGSKRQSALKAREFMKELSNGEDKIKEEPEDYIEYSKDRDFVLTAHHLKREIEDNEEDEEELECAPALDFVLGAEEIKLEPGTANAAKRQREEALKNDFTTQASKFFEPATQDPTDPWDKPVRVVEDPFIDAIPKVNQLEALVSESEIREYLPLMQNSVVFNTAKVRGKNAICTEYHRLSWFHGESVDGFYQDTETDYVGFTGGSVLSMAWHPSGKYLAISTLKHMNEIPNLMEAASRPSSIQIYLNPTDTDSASEFKLLIVGLDHGCANHLQWSTFWPESCNNSLDSVVLEVDNDCDKCFGYLSGGFEDSTCRIFALRPSDFTRAPTFSSVEDSKNKNVRVYKKSPEIILCMDEEARIPTGQCVKFGLDERNRYVVAGYASGHLALFDLTSKSKLLRTNVVDEFGNCFTFLNPIWLMKAHLAPVTAIIMDPKTSRYFYTASSDRTFRAWDIELRMEIENKRVGSVLDMCWIRGWVHVGISVDVALANPGSQFNYIRYYPVGSHDCRSNTVEYYNVTSTSFCEGMTLCGTENGRVDISYYDSFWRDCDYDRNKKKRNLINIGKIEVDENSFDRIPFAKNEDDIKQSDSTEPNITLTFSRERIHGSHEPEPSSQDFENVFRFYPYVRVNKVSWAPDGKFITVGYRNGLFAILPSSFDKLFS